MTTRYTFRHSFLMSLVLASAMLPLGGCLLRTRKVERRTMTTGLRQAARDDLVQRINQEAAKIQTMDATVDISCLLFSADDDDGNDRRLRREC